VCYPIRPICYPLSHCFTEHAAWPHRRRLVNIPTGLATTFHPATILRVNCYSGHVT